MVLLVNVVPGPSGPGPGPGPNDPNGRVACRRRYADTITPQLKKEFFDKVTGCMGRVHA